MDTTARIQNKGQVTIPTRLRAQAGLSKGDVVEFTFERGKIVITPKLVIDRSYFPNADDEDIKAGRVYSFASAKEVTAFLKKSVAQKVKPKTIKRTAR